MITVNTIIGILAAFAASHLGGTAIGSLLARFGIGGFGKVLPIARSVYKVGKALRKSYQKDPVAARRAELKRWLQEHDPENESGFGDGII